MSENRRRFVPIAMLVALTLVADSVAQDPAPGSLELLDRGSAGDDLLRAPGMMAVLDVGLATSMVTPMDIGAGTSLMMAAVPPAFLGNFYAAPADFPPTWYPFAVTGAFAYGLMLPPPTTVMSAVVGAGVAPGPFIPPGMWAGFGTLMAPLPAGMTDMVFSGPLAPALSVPAAPLGVACGILVDPVVGPYLGGVTTPVPPMARGLFTFNGPPITTMDFLSFGFSAYIEWAAGCFVSGATVPVELQSFHID